MRFLIHLYIFIFGLLIGSFLNVVILRLPLKKDLTFTRSACPSCGTQLKWLHNIPLLSFLLLKGRCSFCQTRISWRYPLIELLSGLVALGLFPDELSSQTLTTFFFSFTVACIFICHFFIDLDHHLLLDSLNLYLLILVFVYAVFQYSWGYWLIGGAVGFGVPLVVAWVFYKFKGQIGLGGGDIKLFGVLGILFGPIGIMFTIFLSCFVGAFVGMILIAFKKLTRDRPMAFGPAILLVAAFQFFFPYYSALVQSSLFPMP